MRDAKDVLSQWGRWTWESTGVPRYVSPTLIAMQANEVKSPKKSQIIDCDAEKISAIIARLDRAHPKVSECLHLHYRYGMTQHEVAEKLEVGRQKVRDLLIQADWYIQSELDRLQAIV